MVLIRKVFSALKLSLTPFCQSGRNGGMFAGLALIVATAPASAGQTGWAHQAAGFQNNGAVTVKSLAGGSYAGTQNPIGAVAMANQSAATQAPTVIIQATGGGFSESMVLTTNTAVAPSCPAGYTKAFSTTQTGCPGNSASNPTLYNIAGTRWSLFQRQYSGGGSNFYAAFASDSPPLYYYNGTSAGANFVEPALQWCVSSGNNMTWSATICTR